MKVNDYLNELRKIKDVAMATVDSDGYPQIRIIDVMAVENNNLYFLTARGKNFYQELLDKNFVSLVALTKDYASIRLKGKVKKVSNQKEWLEKIFIDNPSMNEVYPGDSRNILEVFCIFDGEIEIFDLSKVPIERSQYDLCDNRIFNKGYLIKLMDPKYIEVWGKFTPRGGISIDPYCNYGKPETKWETIAFNRLANHDLYPEKIDNR